MLKYKTEWSSLNKTKIAQVAGEHNVQRKTLKSLQEDFIEDPKISTGKNGLDISKSTFNWITKRDLKLHNYKMNVKKERNNYNVLDLLIENQDLWH